MKTAAVLLLCFLMTTALCYFSMNNTNDKEIGALVNHTWYDLLPQKVIQERTYLLNLLGPNHNASFYATHALQVSRVHLLKGGPSHY